MKTTILIFIVLLTIMEGMEHSKMCLGPLLYSQDCTWYLKCLENKYQCGDKGYPKSFGYKYCAKFAELKKGADPIVLKWL